MEFEYRDCESEADQIDRLKDELTAARAEIARLREDKERLDFIINESNAGNGWLDDYAWDRASDHPAWAETPDPLVVIRKAIDAARAAERK